jgi:RNA polymerase sigma factor (TIGR02999 family)
MAAAEAMRRILIENARKKKSIKHGGDLNRVELNEAILISPEQLPLDDLMALDEALEKLAKKDRGKANLVKLRVFAGLTGKQASQILNISPSKASEDLTYAKAWLGLEIKGGEKDRDG